MAFFIITCGEHTFRNPVKGVEQIHSIQCQNCGNHSGSVMKQWDWFTVCFVPIIPLGRSWTQVYCPICRFAQNTDYRPDVQQMIQQSKDGGQIPLQSGPSAPSGPPQGWGGGGGGPPQGPPSGYGGQPPGDGPSQGQYQQQQQQLAYK